MAVSVGPRAVVAASTAALVVLLAGCGGSSGDKAGGETISTTDAAHYEDAVGDAGPAPDVRAVEVKSTSEGRITFRVTVDPVTSDEQSGVDLWLDTDTNPETGNTSFADADGAEYLLSSFLGSQPPANASCRLVAGGKACFARWTESGWSAATAPTARISRTGSRVTISIDRSDLGGTDELNFYAVGWVQDADPDRAPGTGTFNYSLAIGGPNAEASASSGRTSDKAGGKSEGEPIVLTLASHDYDPIEGTEFASTVERLSDGSIRIDVKEGFRYYDVDYERGTIADVRSGSVDLALIGARAWDALGVESFNALVAPFLVDSYAVEGRVLESSASEKMLEQVEPLGLVGIALLPGELRRPLGLSRPLVRPTHYRGARIGIRPAGVADATFAALGARAEGFSATPDGLVGFDGAESGVATISNNGYDRGARALTANVVLWPRPTTIVMNHDAFDALTDDQQDALREAGREALGPVLATIQDTTQVALATICSRGIRLATASARDRAALRQAVQPVYNELERNPLTAELIDAIEAMRREKGSGTEPLRCPGGREGTVPAALSGLWRADVSRADLRAAGAQLEQLERAEGTWMVEIDQDGWVARNLDNGNVYRGTLAVEGDVLRLTTSTCAPPNICVRGHVDEYTWSRYRDTLELAPISGRLHNLAAVAKPFTHVR